MNITATNFFLYIICLWVCFSCTTKSDDILNGIEEKQEVIEIPNVTKAFVNLEKSKMHVLECDTANGIYSVLFDYDMPMIKPGNVVIISTDTTNYVVLVIDAQTVGQQVNMKGEVGDLSYVFSDTRFTFETSNEKTRGAKGNVFHPIVQNIARTSWNLWSTSQSYTSELYKTTNSRIWSEYNLNASVDAKIVFNFSKPIETKIDGIHFVKAKDFNIDFCINGDIDSSYDVFMNMSGKGELDLAPNDKDKYVLLKHNILPQRDFLFPIGPIEIPVTLGCDLFADVSLRYDSALDFTTGIKTNVSGTLGVSYNATTNSGLKPYNTMSFSYEKHNPTITGKGTLEGKVHIFPRIHAWVCGIAGPSVDIKPYAKVLIGGSFKEILENITDNYIASSLRTSVGVDLAVGLSRSSWNYESWNKSTPDMNIGEYPLYSSPYLIKFKEAFKKNDGSIDATFEVYDKGIGDNIFLSPLLPIVKFESDGILENKYQVAKYGMVKVKWKPINETSVLYAKIFDLDGKIISQAKYEYNTNDKGSSTIYNAVDLGLSVKWASCNVGASTPEDYGDYFAWGETSPKSTYTWSNYKWCNGSYMTLTKYCTSSSYGMIDNKVVLDKSDDAASVNLGGDWRMPTTEEIVELRNKCTWTWTTQNGVAGYKVQSKYNGNFIFFPANGYRYENSLDYAGLYGNYWSSSLDESYLHHANIIFFRSTSFGYSSSSRSSGLSVRAVCP